MLGADLNPSALPMRSAAEGWPIDRQSREAIGSGDGGRTAATNGAVGAAVGATEQGKAGVSILVVDDDDDIRDSLGFLLEDEGYKVHTAADGRQALELLERIPPPALALVDLRMPVMDGVELIETMRGSARWARIPVVVFSAAAIVEAPVGVPLLRKPISPAPLLEAVRRYSGAS